MGFNSAFNELKWLQKLVDCNI